MSDCCSPINNEPEKIEVVASGDSCCSDGACSVPNAEATSTTTKTNTCPTCGQKGKAVDTQTVKALLSVSLRTIQEGTQYYFCKTADCDVVYFNEDGVQTYGQDDVRVTVYQKAPEQDETPVCYCFSHTVGEVRAAAHSGTDTILIDDITVSTQVGQCACDIRNPQGSCCLGNVRKVAKSTSKTATV